MSFTFSVKICDTNPLRWYVNYKFRESLHLTDIKSVLQKDNFTIIADTPIIVVFQNNWLKLTWNKHGLIQVDFNDNKSRDHDAVEELILNLLNKFT
ncbi:MAG: hypothetical protein ACXAB2_03975 [Candidatus Hodarchaeales archaeon]|jgi:hypothetical protein